MPIDPSIALQLRPPQYQSPLEAAGKALTLRSLLDERDLRELQTQKLRTDMQRADDERVGLSQFLALPEAQRTPDARAALARSSPNAYFKVGEQELKARKENADIAKNEAEAQLKYLGIMSGAIAPLANRQDLTPDEVRGALEMAASAGVPRKTIDGMLTTLPPDPMNLARYVQRIGVLTDHGLKTLERFAPKVEVKDTGGSLQSVNVNPLAGPVGLMAGTAPIAKTATPDALMTDDRVKAEGAANRSVTMRGQNMTDSRQRDANAITQGNRQQTGVIELRKEFNALPEVKQFKTVVPIVNSIKNAPDTPAGDLDLIYGVGKILDPDSVVREGEMTLVIKSGSPMERFKGQASYVMGGGRLTPVLRQQLTDMLNSRVAGLQQNYQAARATFETAADRQGLPKEQIFIETPEIPQDRRTTPRSSTQRKVVDY